MGEALAGEQAGRVLSHEKGMLPCADPVRVGEGHTTSALARAKGGHGEVGDPMHAWKHSARESGEPKAAHRVDGRVGRSGKSEDGSR